QLCASILATLALLNPLQCRTGDWRPARPLISCPELEHYPSYCGHVTAAIADDTAARNPEVSRGRLRQDCERILASAEWRIRNGAKSAPERRRMLLAAPAQPNNRAAHGQVW